MAIGVRTDPSVARALCVLKTEGRRSLVERCWARLSCWKEPHTFSFLTGRPQGS